VDDATLEPRGKNDSFSPLLQGTPQRERAFMRAKPLKDKLLRRIANWMKGKVPDISESLRNVVAEKLFYSCC